MSEKSTPIGSNWRPSGSECQLPKDIALIWGRVEELNKLGWLTPNEEAERRVLTSWLNPFGPAITDTVVFGVACETYLIGAQSDEEFLLPVYAAAEQIWRNILSLSSGNAVAPPRPEYDAVGDWEDWSATRRRQAEAWWQMVMERLDGLIGSEVIYAFELPKQTTCHEFVQEMRNYFLDPLFDGPMAIGASMYLEPSLPGTGLGFKGQMVNAMDALASAVMMAVRDVEQANAADQKMYERALMRLHFFWEMLKGFTWASASNGSGTPLPSLLVSQLDVWETAKQALLAGKEAINSHSVDGVQPCSFGSRGGALSTSIAEASTDDVIARMERQVKEAQEEEVSLRNFR